MGTYFCFCAGAEKKGLQDKCIGHMCNQLQAEAKSRTPPSCPSIKNLGDRLRVTPSKLLHFRYINLQKRNSTHRVICKAWRNLFSAKVTGELVAVCTKPDASFCSVSLRPMHLLSTLHRPQRGSCYSGQTPVGKQPKTASTL